MLLMLRDAPYEVFRLPRDRYYQLADEGAFEGRRVELIDGVVITMNSMRGPHATAVMNLTLTLAAQVQGHGALRPGIPLHLSDYSEPEPDFAIIDPKDLPDDGDHPRTASLVIEISESSLAFDLGLKADLYAAAKIPEYWVVDLVHQKLVAHLSPKRGKYTRVSRFGRGKSVTSTVAPKVTVAVDSLFR
jgi:Uma2 family endonuclease